MFPGVRIEVDRRGADESGSPLGPLGQILSKVGSAAGAGLVQISLTDDDHPVCQAESAGSATSVRSLDPSPAQPALLEFVRGLVFAPVAAVADGTVALMTAPRDGFKTTPHVDWRPVK